MQYERGKGRYRSKAGNSDVKAHLGALVMEAFQEALQQLICIVNPLSVLAYYPDHSSTGLGLIQGVQVLAQRGYHTLIPGKAGLSQQVSTKEVWPMCVLEG